MLLMANDEHVALLANLSGANLSGASLYGATLVKTDLTDADLTGCRIYGASAWRLKLDRTRQQNLVITDTDEPEVTVDNIEVAQFIYLLLHNEKICDVIDTIGKKGALLLGRFTEGRMQCWSGCATNSATSASCRWSSTSISPTPRTSPRRFGCWLACPSS
jgi:hypothetical protein